MKAQLKGPKGVPDLVPPVSRLHEQIMDTSLEIFRRFAYRRIETPAFENTELFERGLEAGSDIVTKEMYTFQDKGGRSLTLRPDMTAPVMRSILEHNLDKQGLPLKLYYCVPVFRHEKPQSGRFRQFTQVGVEAVGSAGPQIDSEVIGLAFQVYGAFGIKVEMKLNSIGHPACRAVYLPKLMEFLESHRTEICSDCARKIEKNPLRTFDCKVPSDIELMKQAPLMTEDLCSECSDHFAGLKKMLDDSGCDYIEDPRLVRGLDYYTKTAFEFVAPGLGSQDAVGAGGRYDGLSEQLGGPILPGVGFGLGVARIALAMQAAGIEPSHSLEVYVIALSQQARERSPAIVSMLRSSGLSVDLDHDGKAPKAQFKAADRAGSAVAVVIGDRELEAGVFTVRDMTTGAETPVPEGQIVNFLKKEITT